MLRNPLTIAVILMSNMPRNSDFHLPNTRVIYSTTSKRNVPVFPRNERQLQDNTQRQPQHNFICTYDTGNRHRILFWEFLTCNSRNFRGNAVETYVWKVYSLNFFQSFLLWILLPAKVFALEVFYFYAESLKYIMEFKIVSPSASSVMTGWKKWKLKNLSISEAKENFVLK